MSMNQIGFYKPNNVNSKFILNKYNWFLTTKVRLFIYIGSKFTKLIFNYIKKIYV